MNAKIKVVSSPVKTFMSDKFRQILRSIYDRGEVGTRLYLFVGEDMLCNLCE